MLVLYAWVDCWTKLDASFDESHLVKTMLNLYKEQKTFDFMIKKISSQGDDIYIRTRTEKEFIEYIDSFKLRQKSCVELKKEMVKTLKK